MKKTKTDNSDIIDYLNTTQELNKYPDIKSFWQEYKRLREDAPIGKTNQFYSAHKELRRLDKKRNKLLSTFISELNPVKREKTSESFMRRSLARTLISEKSDDEIISMLLNQRTETLLKFQRDIESSLTQLSEITSVFNTKHENTPHRKFTP